jgi:hypothetical protein
MLASTQATLLIKKVNDIFIQAATSFRREELSFHFSMSLYMQASMPQTHKPIHRVVVGASYALDISFKQTTGDCLDAEHPLKPLDKRSTKSQTNLHNNN